LVGDAAHRVHPLAGQGVNLGFGDVDSLAEVVEGMVVEGGGLGHHEYLCQYETDRQRHNLATMVGVDCLQKLYCTRNTPMVLARSLGIMATNAAQPVKKLILQHAG
jgi:ubiquinone biosynthesis monooxygenase Coq6